MNEVIYPPDTWQHALKIGFVGTAEGLTRHQTRKVFDYLAFPQTQVVVGIHGDETLADQTFAEVCSQLGYYVVARPGHFVGEQGEIRNTPAHHRYAAVSYLVHNRQIIENADVVLACPDDVVEQLNSPFWEAIRYARCKEKRITLIGPDGVATEEWSE